jgi:flavin reductase (DIM6/NTAB) family NADH-FMN oxidoreductase RutF
VFYTPESRDKTLLPHDPFKALIAPRPIGWVSTKGRSGAVNLAPYSFFNAICESPPMIMFSSHGRKDSLTFAEETREFVWNMATYGLREAMNQTAAMLPCGENEFTFAGLEMAKSHFVAPPRVAASPAALECKVTNIQRILDIDAAPTEDYLVFGQVVGVYIDDTFVRDGRVDAAAMLPLARCGYMDYVVASTLFEMPRPPRV